MDYQITDQIDAIQSAQDIEELLLVVEKLAKSLGFEYFSFGHRSHTPISSPKLDLVSNYPDAWKQSYQDNEYFKEDPTIAHALKSTAPLIWSEDTFKNASELKEDAEEYGIKHGWSQATKSFSGTSMLTLVRSTEGVSDYELAKKSPYLMWFTQILNTAFEELISNQNILTPDIALTTRETEILRWTAEGKTSNEISIILGIAERTVNFHLKNVMTKLDSNNKISATVKAIALSLI